MEQAINKNVGVVILAAGEGKRMKSELPKVMNQLKGKPLIGYVVSTVENAGLGKPVIVVGYKQKMIQDYLGPRAAYIIQEKQLGTGHAVVCAEDKLHDADNVVVLYGDMPFISESSIKKLIGQQKKEGAAIVLATVTVKSFEGVGKYFYDFGRIIRNDKNEIIKDVEIKDATAKELEVNEVNSGFYCFDAKWLWENLKNLKTNNAQGELYLTDLINMAFEQKKKIGSITIDAKEAVGINTQEQLGMAHNL